MPQVLLVMTLGATGFNNEFLRHLLGLTILAPIHSRSGAACERLSLEQNMNIALGASSHHSNIVVSSTIMAM